MALTIQTDPIIEVYQKKKGGGSQVLQTFLALPVNYMDFKSSEAQYLIQVTTTFVQSLSFELFQKLESQLGKEFNMAIGEQYFLH